MIKSKKVVLTILSALTVACASIGISAGVKRAPLVSAEVVGSAVLESEIKTSYALGEILTVPNGQISYGGQTYSADEEYVVAPDGRILDGASVALDKIGNYQVVYAKKQEDTIIKATKEFTVENGTYTLTGNKSTIEYGVLAHGKLDSENNPTESGIKIGLKAGDKFVYNQAIDLSESDLTAPVITYYTSHSSNRGLPAGYKECQGLYLQLTDCYDPTNTLTLYCDWWDNGAPYYRAFANGQMETGLAAEESKSPGSTSKEYFANDKRYLCYMNYAGTYYWPIFRQMKTEGVGVSVYYDAESKSMWLGGKAMDMVTDFDDPAIYGTKLFKGFTTGEVYLSMWADRYVKETVTIEIANIDGRKGAYLTPTNVEDERAPLIELDDRGATSLDNLVIAKDEPVRLFDAVAYDVNDCTPVKRVVYYGYGTEAQMQVGTENGYLVPNKVGAYTVVYEVVDGFGNKAEKIITLHCKKVEGNKVLTLSTEKLTELVAGKVHALPEYTLEGVNAGKKLTISATSPSGETVEIDSQSRAFAPQEAGEYTIIYHYSDNIYTYEYKYNVNCTANGYVSFSKPYLPNYFIKNAKYTLDKVVATEYSSAGGKEVSYKVYMSADGGAYSEIDMEDFAIAANETVKFKFEVGAYAMETESVKVVDVGFGGDLNMGKYFAGDCTPTLKDTSILFRASKTGDNTMEFVNVVSFSQFKLEFSVSSLASAYKGIKIELIDFYDREKVETFVYKNVSGSLTLNYNGGTDIVKTTTFAGTGFSLAMDNGEYIDNTGSKFECAKQFTTDKALLRITLLEVSEVEKGAIEIKKLCNQGLSKVTKDRIEPIVIPDYTLGGSRNVGDSVELSLPQVIDILSPFYVKNLTLTITKPSGGVVEGFDGSVCYDEAKALTITECGNYFISYAYEDQSRRYGEGSFTIIVEDRVAPQITVSGVTDENYVQQAKLGESVKLLSYTVADNIDTTETIIVKTIVYSPEYQRIQPTDNAFKATAQGEYKVYYYCMDTQGNCTVVSYTVRVSK